MIVIQQRDCKRRTMVNWRLRTFRPKQHLTTACTSSSTTSRSEIQQKQSAIFNLALVFFYFNLFATSHSWPPPSPPCTACSSGSSEIQQKQSAIIMLTVVKVILTSKDMKLHSRDNDKLHRDLAWRRKTCATILKRYFREDHPNSVPQLHQYGPHHYHQDIHEFDRTDN